MGKKDQALATVEKWHREHSNLVTTLKVRPTLDPLRREPRFQELLRSIGLADR
jgi:hypothetical protein